MFSRFFRSAVLAAALASAGIATTASAAVARTNYDGNWSVLIITQSGACDRAYRYGVQISDGNVFYEGDGARFTDKGGFPIDYSFNTSNLKASAGLAVQWLAPLGLFKFSYAMPLKRVNGSELDYGDETEQFQFSIGNAF